MARFVHEGGTAAVLAEVVDLELQLLDPEIRADPDHVRSLLHPEFEEVGASGRHWHRDAIVDALSGDPGPGFHATQVASTLLAPDVVLVTYAVRTAGADERLSRRSSVWVRDHGRWRMRYHQGTPCA